MIYRPLHSIRSFHAAILLFIAFSFVMLPVRNGYILRWYDEMSIFMSGEVFLNRMLHYPGGMLQYAGAWLTQFMYFPWAGSAILIALWVILTILCDRVWRLREGLRGLSLLPAMFLLVSVLVLDEAWVSINYPGYLFAPTLGTICIVTIAAVARLIANNIWRGLFLAACTSLFMPLGFFALFGAIVGILTPVSPRHENTGHKKQPIYIGILPVIVAIALIPLLYYNFYTGMSGDIKSLYIQGLPDLLVKRHDLYLWLPIAGLTVTLLLLPLMSLIMPTEGSAKPGRARWLTFSVLIAAGCYGAIAGQKSEQFRATVLMMQHIDSLRWDKIAYIMSHIKEEPNFTMKIAGNLAAIKLGGGTESVRHDAPLHDTSPRKSEEFLMSAFVNVPVYYHLGNTHGSYRWAMEHTVKYGPRVFYYKYMVRNSIMHGEYELASRYNRLLLNTMFHRRWAEHFQRYIDNPELIKESREFNSIPGNPSEKLFI